MDTKSETEAKGADAPIACTLTDNDAATQALEWVDLQHWATSVTAIEGGVRMTLPSSLVGDIEDLARREAACCAFLTLNTSVSNDVLTLDISSAKPDASPVVVALAGLPFP